MFDPASPSLRKRLREKRGIGVHWFALGNVALVEMSVAAGAEAIVIDMQHGLFDRTTLEAALGAVPSQIPCLVRVEDDSATAIGRALDAGAEGVIIPLVETAGQAERAAAACHYPPKGHRSGGGVRPLRDFGAYVGAAADAITVAVMIETALGVENAAAIAATRNVDFVFIGTGDLALSLGTTPSSDIHGQACAAVLQACCKAGIPCGTFTFGAQAAAAKIAQGYWMSVVLNDISAMSGAAVAATAAFSEAQARLAAAASGAASLNLRSSGSGASLAEKPGEPQREDRMMDAADTLETLATLLLSGDVEVVDLAVPLGPHTPLIKLPPPFQNTPAVEVHTISHYDNDGPYWAWNWLKLGEHSGTHFDAPVHWITGRDYADGTTDRLPVQKLVGPACVIDCSSETAADEDFLLTADRVRAWESEHGEITAGSWVLMRTGWHPRNRSEAEFLNVRDNMPHSPGPTVDCIEYLIGKGIVGWGTETVGTDAGKAGTFDPPYPAHNLLHKNNRYGLASLANLDRLPPTGAVLIAAPLKFVNGTGSPIRALALVPRMKA